nr:thiol-disulfide oxidoreductase DCC family protein [uncultured Pedobacter sp.]
MKEKGIVLFDGFCNLCDGFVQRIIIADKNDYFRFASLQSEAGQNLLKNHPDLQDLKSIVYLEKDQVFTKANAALKIASHLSGSWKLLRLGYLFPNFLRNSIYDIIAKYRYQWFGKKDQCMVPTPELKSKFL